jgi:hypothetical protein
MTVFSFCRPVAVVVSMAVAGCAPWQTSEPVTPASYKISSARISRTVGKLRRLAVLRVDQAPPKACRQGFDCAASLGSDDPKGFVGTIITNKGYEVIVLDEARYADWLRPPSRDGLAVELFAHLHEPGDGSAGPRTRALLEQLREEDRVDGLLVVGAEYFLEAYPVYRVLVFETTSARAVWRNEWNSTNQLADHFKNMGAPQAGLLPVESLLEPLEPAVPKVLTR